MTESSVRSRADSCPGSSRRQDACKPCLARAGWVWLSGDVSGKPELKETSTLSVRPPESDGKAIEARFGRREEIIIGRGVDCDVVIKDAKASRRHCRLTRRSEGFALEDLGSKNGTWVDGKRIAEQVLLRPDQTFKVGDTIFYLSH